MGLELTYNSLVAMLEAWCEDDDDEFVEQIPNIIGLSECELQKDLDLEIFNVTATGAFTTGQAGRLLAKPADLLVLRTMQYTSGSTIVHMLKRDAEYIEDYWPDISLTAAPKFFAEYTDTQWLVGPCPDSAYTYKVRYTKRPASLSASNQTTWLGTYAGDALFKCCMKHAEQYLKEDLAEGSRITMFTNDYLKAVATARSELKNMMQHEYSLAQATPAQPQ